MDQKHQGCFSELKVCLHLLEQGYEVFKNISSHGVADLVAWKPGEPPIFLDIKTHSTEAIKNTLSERQRELGVKLVSYAKSTGTILLHRDVGSGYRSDLKGRDKGRDKL